MPGLGVGEFIQFAGEWWKYEDGIRNKTVPLRINVTRPKTGISYWVLEWDDDRRKEKKLYHFELKEQVTETTPTVEATAVA